MSPVCLACYSVTLFLKSILLISCSVCNKFDQNGILKLICLNILSNTSIPPQNNNNNMSGITEALYPAPGGAHGSEVTGHQHLEISFYCPFHLWENSSTVSQLKNNDNIYAIIITEKVFAVDSVSRSGLCCAPPWSRPSLSMILW